MQQRNRFGWNVYTARQSDYAKQIKRWREKNPDIVNTWRKHAMPERTHTPRWVYALAITLALVAGGLFLSLVYLVTGHAG